MDTLFILFIFFLGAAIGSFINVVVYRLKFELPLAFDRSKCVTCKKIIRWFDNIPLVSFLVLKGKCRQCKTSYGAHYVLVELVVGLLFVWLYFIHGLSLLFIRDVLFVSFLTVIFLYDLYYYLILDKVVVPAVIIAVLFNLYLGIPWVNLVLGAVLGGGFFLLQFIVSKGRWIGGGDIRLGALMGCMLGWKLTLAALFMAYVGGAFVGIFLLIFGGKKMSSKVPFGTFLSAATVVSLVYGEQLVSWYLSQILWR